MTSNLFWLPFLHPGIAPPHLSGHSFHLPLSPLFLDFWITGFSLLWFMAFGGGGGMRGEGDTPLFLAP